MSILDTLLRRRPAPPPAKAPPDTSLPGEPRASTSEVGFRPTPENRLKYLYRQMWADPELRRRILDIRAMDVADPRIKKIHRRTAAETIKGGLRLRAAQNNETLTRAWRDFSRRLRLDRREKLESDARGLFMEGNLPMQWVLGPDRRVMQAVRMPAETILPVVTAAGVFRDPAAAYEQYDLATGSRLAVFALWQLTLGRLGPDNYDDFGSLGRPYMDASREVWRKLRMTEEDLVIRRRERAPLRTSHVLKGATPDELTTYKGQVEDDQKDITTNYYSNREGGVTAIQGDANLDQIADVAYLLDTLFAGSPAPKGLFGYVGDLSRDVLEDLTRDFYEVIDSAQDLLADVYRVGFELDLLLQGINPDAADFTLGFAERKTETPNQAADRALKLQAMGASRSTVFEVAGLDVEVERARLEQQLKDGDPYPDPNAIGTAPGDRPGAPRVSITPGNARKAESGTAISN